MVGGPVALLDLSHKDCRPYSSTYLEVVITAAASSSSDSDSASAPTPARRQRWTIGEDQILLVGYEFHGDNWTRIFEDFPNETCRFFEATAGLPREESRK
ncbi:hypothetical protein V6N13_001093 [Hibiscus sabdariffa]|uniref:Myb-like domain-containing protein n=1 Tax=Hibiscus sabdariffa TaxID=183260 RepID=A0ABR2G7F8_9ROSI